MLPVSGLRPYCQPPPRMEIRSGFSWIASAWEKISVSQYEAVSYAWGSNENPVEIYVGATGDQVIPVTENLAVALRHLRYETTERLIWADAICINQQNLEERSRQVLRMAEIYQGSKGSIVWLGPGSTETRKGMEIMRQLASEVEVDWIQGTMKPSVQAIQSGDLSWTDKEINFEYSRNDIDALYSVLSRPWFERLWIRQEIWLTSESAVVYCGTNTLPWKDFRVAVFCLHDKASAIVKEDLRYVRNRLNFIAELCNNSGFIPISTLLINGQQAKCSDLRDRVFLILAMIHESERIINLQPDYTKSIAEVYENFVLSYIGQIGYLHLLKACNLDRKQAVMPTWVPNWNAPSQIVAFRDFGQRASGSSECRATYLGNGVLEVGGAIVATVKKANSVNLRESTLKNAISRIRKFAPANLAAAYPTGYTVFDGYMRAIYPGVFSTDFVPPNEALPEMGLCRSLLGRLLEDSSFMDESKHSNLEYRELYFIAAIGVHLRDFSFLITQEGYLGYGSPAAEAGDKICLLLGFDELMILRSVGDDKYEVVGPAFVNGLMNCEGLLGNFLAIFKPVLRRHTERGEYFHVYVNQETGEFQTEDPRKPPLSSGWKKSEHVDDKWWDLYKNTDTGESAGDRDPRLRFESLVDAGCKMEKFLLI